LAEIQRFEYHMGGAVGVGGFQLVAYLPVAGQGQALGGYGRSCHIAAQAFQFVTLGTVRSAPTGVSVDVAKQRPPAARRFQPCGAPRNWDRNRGVCN